MLLNIALKSNSSGQAIYYSDYDVANYISDGGVYAIKVTSCALRKEIIMVDILCYLHFNFFIMNIHQLFLYTGYVP